VKNHFVRKELLSFPAEALTLGAGNFQSRFSFAAVAVIAVTGCGVPNGTRKSVIRTGTKILALELGRI
jgi:hypothetical protein